MTTPDTSEILIIHGNSEGMLSGPFLLRCDYRNPNAVAVADLNRDGKYDLVVTVDPVILSYLGDGEGNFTIIGGAYNGPSAMTMPTLGDFTNDGILDLTGVFVSFQDVVSVMIGTSSGSFSRFGNYQSTSYAHAGANSLTVGDINKDGYLELIAAHDNPGHVCVLWGDGTAKFFTRSSFDLNTSSNSVAVANQDSGSVSVLIGDGTGDFSGMIRFATGETPIKIIALDFNRDGMLDLATANQGSEDISIFLNTTISSIHRTITKPPDDIVLFQNYPNPFNPSAKIQFYLPQTEDVLLEIFNPLGQKILALADKNLPAGEHNVTFDASDFPSGIYYYQLVAGDYREVKKMILLR